MVNTGGRDLTRPSQWLCRQQGEGIRSACNCCTTVLTMTLPKLKIRAKKASEMKVDVKGAEAVFV